MSEKEDLIGRNFYDLTYEELLTLDTSSVVTHRDASEVPPPTGNRKEDRINHLAHSKYPIVQICESVETAVEQAAKLRQSNPREYYEAHPVNVRGVEAAQQQLQAENKKE